MTTAEKPHSSPGANGAALTLAERSERVDRIVIDAAAPLLCQAGVPQSGLAPSGVAVLAVGGYGRRQLFPYSDVDVLILFESERLLAAAKDAVSAFLQKLWDSALRVSHSVRTLAECLEVHEQNTELNVSLLDRRYVAGDRALYAALADKLPRFIHANRETLIRNLARLSRQRHAKFANTIHHLEPNVKESPGGLRDYQLVRWLGQLRQQDPEPPLEAAFLYLTQVRCFLHLQAARDCQRAFFRCAGCHCGTVVRRRPRARHARVLSPCASHIPRRRTGSRRPRGAAQFAARAVPRLARAPRKCGFQRSPRAGAFSRSVAAGERPRAGAAPLRVHRASWHSPLGRSGAADRCPAAESAPLFRRAAARCGRMWAAFFRCRTLLWRCAPCTKRSF